MDIQTFLKENKISRQEFAESLKTTPGYLNHLITRYRLPSFKMAKRIMDISDGKISLADLRPDILEQSP